MEWMSDTSLRIFQGSHDLFTYDTMAKLQFFSYPNHPITYLQYHTRSFYPKQDTKVID